MSASVSIQQYVSNQDKYTLRRRFMRWMLNVVGFGVLIKLEVTGEENIPATGSTILMMNHIGFIDPAVCMGAVKSRFVIPMTKIENARNPLFGILVKMWGAYTVDRGTLDRSALMNSIELLKSGQMILIAPEGTRHPEGLAQPKDGLTYVATKADAIILPTALAGSQNFGSSWKRLRRPKVTLNFGRPFRFKTDGRTRIPRDELALMTQEAMYQLAMAQTDANLRGIYSDLEQATTTTLEFVDPLNP
jgi:1-acyl-sn-glycerol-3-phosphate acyltransferase